MRTGCRGHSGPAPSSRGPTESRLPWSAFLKFNLGTALEKQSCGKTVDTVFCAGNKSPLLTSGPQHALDLSEIKYGKVPNLYS